MSDFNYVDYLVKYDKEVWPNQNDLFNAITEALKAVPGIDHWEGV